MRIGYVRVSTRDQNPALQRQALEAAGCDRLFEETGGGGRWDRPQLQAALAFLREGDELVVWKLDRVSRSLPDLLRLIAQLEEEGVRFRSLTEGIETATPAGRMVAAMLGAFAQYEREIIAERTRAGLSAAKARGVKLGRRRVLTASQATHAAEMVLDQGKGVRETARLLGVSPQTISRVVRAARISRSEHRPVA
jgi:DNA invertase Pin-like site-specific DNA recombinase